MESVSSSVIQATGRMDFEDGSRTGTKLEVRNGLQIVYTIHEVYMVSPWGAGHDLGAVWRQTNFQLAKSCAISGIQYSCYCGVRIVNWPRS